MQQPENPNNFSHYARVANTIHPGSVARTNTFIRTVWAWMAGGLAITAVISLFVGLNPSLFAMVAPMMLPLILVELGLVVFLSMRIQKMQPQTAVLSFIAYSALNGVTLSTIFMVYQLPGIASAFIATTGTFGAMTVYGLVTKRDLSQWRTFLMMGLIGIIIASVVNIFMGSHLLGWLITYAGVLVFTGLTAYDTQKLVKLGGDIGDDAAQLKRFAILGALTLYLDFINLFLFMLRFMGGRNE